MSRALSLPHASGLIIKMGYSLFPAGAHLVSLALWGVLANPARGQKSSLGLIAQQTAAEAEWNANVALLERNAKKVQREWGFLSPPGSWCRVGGQVAPRGDLGGG